MIVGFNHGGWKVSDPWNSCGVKTIQPRTERYKQYASRHGQDAAGNPSGGNLFRGLYNIVILASCKFCATKKRESRLSRCGLLVDGFFYHRSWGSKVWVHPARSLLMFVWISALSMANEYGMTSQATTSWILLEMTWNPLLDKWPVAATSFSLWQEMEWGCSVSSDRFFYLLDFVSFIHNFPEIMIFCRQSPTFLSCPHSKLWRHLGDSTSSRRTWISMLGYWTRDGKCTILLPRCLTKWNLA